MSNNECFEESIASSDEENVSRRKKMFVDALFGVFKESIKSLKRDFSKFRHDANIKSENKRVKA